MYKFPFSSCGDMENVDTNILFVCFWPWWWIPLREGHTFVKLHEKSFHPNGDIKSKFCRFYLNTITEKVIHEWIIDTRWTVFLDYLNEEVYFRKWFHTKLLVFFEIENYVRVTYLDRI